MLFSLLIFLPTVKRISPILLPATLPIDIASRTESKSRQDLLVIFRQALTERLSIKFTNIAENLDQAPTWSAQGLIN